jgi:hypothetical protein
MEDIQQGDSAKIIATILKLMSVALFYLQWFPLRQLWVTDAFLAAVLMISVGLLASTKGQFRFGGSRKDSGSSLSLPFFLCGGTLFIRVLCGVNVVPFAFMLILAPVLILALILTLVIVIVDKSAREGLWAGIFVLAAIYFYSVLVEANRYLDSSDPKTFNTEVRKRIYSSGRGGVIRYLRVAPWGQFSAENDVKVPPLVYDSFESGQMVCINLHPGALKIAWYDVARCH